MEGKGGSTGSIYPPFSYFTFARVTPTYCSNNRKTLVLERVTSSNFHTSSSFSLPKPCLDIAVVVVEVAIGGTAAVGCCDCCGCRCCCGGSTGTGTGTSESDGLPLLLSLFDTAAEGGGGGGGGGKTISSEDRETNSSPSWTCSPFESRLRRSAISRSISAFRLRRAS